MGWMSKLRNTMLRQEPVADEIDEELRFHVEELARELEAQGMSAAEARRRAARQLGGAAQWRESTRDADMLVTLDAWLRDARLAWRGLVRRPGLMAAVVGSLAAGIALNSSVFSVVDAVLLKPLPLERPEEVMSLQETIDGNRVGGNPARFRDWREQATALTDHAGFYQEGLVMTGRGDVERVEAQRTFGAPLRLLATRPMLGRAFTEAEERAEGEAVVLLTHSFWQKRFGADRGVVGQPLTLSKKNYTVIGVLPANLQYPAGIDVMIPAELEFQKADRSGNWFSVVARKRPEVSMQQLRAQLDTIATGLAREHPGTEKNLRVTVQPLQDAQAEPAAQPLRLLMATVAMVLLVACLNIASLLLARASERGREMAVRASLGAGRGSIARLFLLESAWLALLGGAAGVLLAIWGVEWLKSMLPDGVPRLEEVALDGRVLLFTLAATVACALVAGLLPAWQASASVSGELLREGRGTVNPRSRQRVRKLLVIAQAAFSVMLLVGGFLALQGFLSARSRALGFQPAQRTAVAVHLTWNTPSDELRRLTGRLLDEFKTLPGVRRVGVIDALPLAGQTQSGSIRLQGVELPETLRRFSVDQRTVSAGVFAALGQPLLTGRVFADRAGAGPVEVVINQAFADKFLAGRNPLGMRIAYGREPEPGKPAAWKEIVGVVGDVRRTPLDPAAHPAFYQSYLQGYWPMNEFILETSIPASAAAIRAAVQRVDPNQPVLAIQTLEASLNRYLAQPRVQAMLIGAFALGALLLAALGLYGLLASDVAQRTQEMGVRLALGATRPQLVAMLVRQGAGVAAVGLLAGIAAAVGMARFMAGSIAGIPELTWQAPLAAAVVLVVVAVLASLLPARRAASVAPASALRCD